MVSIGIKLIAINPATIATVDIITTVNFCEKPAFNSLWWICSASATNGDLPLKIRLRLEYVISAIGTANTKNGKSIASVALFITPVIDIEASINPENSAPESPINIFAGLKLKVKNAIIEPARINPISALIGFGGVIASAIIARVTAFIVITEPANPSTPSIKLTALLIPTIHNIVKGYENHILR